MIVFVSEIPVEKSVAGSALLFRMFNAISANRLLFIELNVKSKLDRRVENAEYQSYYLPGRFIRVLKKLEVLNYLSFYFFQPIIYLLLRYQLRQKKIKGIVSVTHGFGWIVAGKLADKLNVPLYLILHDHFEYTYNLSKADNQKVLAYFKKYYQQAEKKYCVSPYMEEYYRKRFGIAGDILYPCRDPEIKPYDHPPAALSSSKGAITIGYAGSISSNEYAEIISTVANALYEECKGELVLFSNVPLKYLQKNGLKYTNVIIKDFIPPPQLVSFFRKNVDLLLVPMAFDPSLETAFRTNFPSKLTDYTVPGLPLLIIGPEYSSAVRWAQENHGIALVSTEVDLEKIKSCIRKLIQYPNLRMSIGQKAIDVGAKYFNSASITKVFKKNFE